MNHFPIEARLCLLPSWIVVYKKNHTNFQFCKELKNNSTKFNTQDITIIVPSWSYDSWIYNYLCTQCLSPLKFCVRIPIMARCTQYNIMWLFFSDLRQVGGFLRVFLFPPPIKLKIYCLFILVFCRPLLTLLCFSSLAIVLYVLLWFIAVWYHQTFF